MDKVKKAMTHLQCELVAERNLVNPNEITWLQYDILLMLSQQQCLLPSDLCISLGVSRVKLAKALKKLKQQEYIIQNRSLLDGRELETAVTQKGLILLKTIDTGHDYLAALIHQVMNTAEQEIFSELAARLSIALQERRMQHETANPDY